MNSSGIKKKRPIYLEKNLLILFAIVLMAILGFSAITPAFPKIVQELSIAPQDVGLLISVYTIPGVVFIPVFGVLADRFGRKKILIPSLLLFGVAGVAGGFARDFNLLLTLRFFQGVGASCLIPLTVVVACDLYTGDERTAAMCYHSSFISIGAAVFPIIGGAVATFGWHYPFLLPIMAIPVALLTLLSLKNPEPKGKQRLSEYLADALQSMRNPKAYGLYLASAVTPIILFGSFLTYFPLLIGNSFDASPFVIGLIISSAFLVNSLTSSMLGRSASGYSERKSLMTSFVLYALALAVIPFISNIWLLLVPSAIFGIAHGHNVPSRHTLVAKLAPMEHRAVFTSVNELIFLFGMALGPILMGTIFGLFGIGAVFYAGTGFAIAMFLLEGTIMK